jgi:hypothetical protein
MMSGNESCGTAAEIVIVAPTEPSSSADMKGLKLHRFDGKKC